MNLPITDILLAILLLLDICLVSSSRLLHCIRLCAIQGMIIGILPCLTGTGVPHWPVIAMAVISFIVKGIGLPWLLARTMRRCAIKRELEPLVPYGVSLLGILIVCVISFYGCGRSTETLAKGLGLPVVFVTLYTGLFMIMARRKAIVQVIGFLFFENGIGLFGSVMHLENGILTELGILLDVLALTFIMGIAIFSIRREFSHIDADRMNQLSDTFHSLAKPEK